MLQKLTEQRATAIAAARAAIEADEWNEEAYRSAMTDAERLNGIITDEKRRVEMEAVAVESRAAVDEIRRSQTTEAQVEVQRHDSEREQLRQLLTPGSPVKSMVIMPPSARANEEFFKDTSSTVKAGYTVPTTLYDQVLYHINAQSGVAKCNITRFNTGTGEQITMPTLVTDAAANLTAERTAATLTNPVFGQAVLDSYRVDGTMKATLELLRDTATNMEAVIGQIGARAVATKVANLLAVGTGSSQPQGVNPVAAAGVTAVGTTDFTMDELLDLYYSVLPGYRAVGEWVVGDTAMLKIAKKKNLDDNYYFQPTVTADQPDRLLGRPIYGDADYPACTTGLKPITFGDMGQFWLRSVGGFSIERDDSVLFTSYQATYRFAMYIDSELVDRSGAVKVLTLA